MCKKIFLYLLIFLCFQELRAFGVPSDSLKLKPKKFSHFVGLGNRTGGEFVYTATQGEPIFTHTYYHLNNFLNLSYLFQINNSRNFFFSFESKLLFKQLKRRKIYNDYYSGKTDSILAENYYKYCTLNLLPTLNFRIMQKERYYDLLSFSLDYQSFFFLFKSNYVSIINPSPKFGLTLPFLNFKLANSFFVKLGKKAIGLDLYLTFALNSQRQVNVASYAKKDFMTDFKYQFYGKQHVLFKTIGFNLYYQL